MSEPLTEERLEEIREHILGKSQFMWTRRPLEMRREAQALLAEVDRLRAQATTHDAVMERINALDEERRSVLLANRRQRTQLATWRWLVQAVAELDVTRALCNFPQCVYLRDQAIESGADHAPDCPVTLARAALEAESQEARG